MNIDLTNLPKKFAENVVIAAAKEQFFMGILTGGAPDMFAFTPAHAKRLSQSLAHNIEEYEKKFGTIDATWTPGIPSPIQTNDLGEDKGA